MTRRLAAIACPLLCLLLACGKYGAPVRAEAEPKPESKQSVETPLPALPERGAPDPDAPLPATEPPIEKEPPPEGSP